MVVCDIHTHPYGRLTNPDGTVSLKHNFFSGADMDITIQYNKILTNYAQEYGKQVKTMAGLIAIDNAGGNSLISFVQYENGRFYRFNNVKVVENIATYSHSDLSIDAIRGHTLGRCGMSNFEKIVFLADKIEARTREPKFRNDCMNTLKEVNVQYVKSRLSMPQVSKKIPRGLKTEKADEGT